MLSTKNTNIIINNGSKFIDVDSKGQLIHFYPLEISFCPLKKKKVFIRETTVRIGPFSFHSNQYITNISFPASITHIGKASFSFCSNLKIVSFPTNSKLEMIDDCAFE